MHILIISCLCSYHVSYPGIRTVCSYFTTKRFHLVKVNYGYISVRATSPLQYTVFYASVRPASKLSYSRTLLGVHISVFHALSFRVSLDAEEAANRLKAATCTSASLTQSGVAMNRLLILVLIGLLDRPSSGQSTRKSQYSTLFFS